MPRFPQLLGTGVAVMAAATLSLTGCNSAKQGMKEAASGMGDAASTAVDGATQTALAPAVNPVLDLLKKGQGEVSNGNLAAAAATMGGFKGLWEKAGPVIKPLAGDKYPAIETAANTLISTFGGGTPDAAGASAAIGGLMGPLSALIGK
ncbi:hypothetical protein KQ313_07655 [Synechococcus sp. CS-1325]|uniref:hypothetical protein n=1 Tax=unclassified Synechococcus TaxID=2626047 RepID=UPI000DB0932D|nr:MULTISPECIES: hypothetical protein [unclassified Synechococcus]MCT0199550.1 hypothetical protein [Synechococcus sp. CS-1325]MCT0213142.1 hypothetical protein [Synechococcus sp. CS-1326]MCT0233030.1 hypothetical protein [Synechococcus sp. CS-1327]PZV01946.1 MAG: hypothetical protein DCF24_03220 [Cyanobium sp.]